MRERRPCMRRKAMSAAIALMALASADAGEPARDAVARGNALFKEGKFAEAAAAYQETQGPATPDLLYNLGCAQASAGELAAAEESFKRAVAMSSAGRAGAAARYN